MVAVAIAASVSEELDGLDEDLQRFRLAAYLTATQNAYTEAGQDLWGPHLDGPSPDRNVWWLVQEILTRYAVFEIEGEPIGEFERRKAKEGRGGWQG